MPLVTFVGTGEALDPDLPNTSVLYQGARTLLLDCGYAVPHALWKITRDPSCIDAVYISHRHADHAFGLPALLLWMRHAGRTKPLDVIGGPDTGWWLSTLLDLAYPGSYAPEKCFPIRPMSLEPGAFHDFGPVRLTVAQSRHGVQNLAVRLDEDTTSVCYSGDGAPTSATRRLFDGATVLVHECYAADAPSKGHAHVGELLDMQREIGVKTLCLVHLGEQRDIIRTRCAGNARVIFPAPGDQIPVGRTSVRIDGEWQ